MYPIYMYESSGSEGMDFVSFSEKMIEVCKKHRQADRALAFGFILCNFSNPHIWKILNDREYWMALNEISGKYLSIFSLNYNPEQGRTDNKRLVFNWLTSVTSNDNPCVATNTLIQKYFKETKINYPAILFFQVDNESVIDSLLIDLEEEEVEKSFLELKDYLTKAVSALRKIAPENKQNVGEVFHCLEEELKALRRLKKIKRIAQNAGNIASLLSSIKSIL